MALTTIEHFVVSKGRDAGDIILRKITAAVRDCEELQPTSLYNVEYQPRLIVRKTTGYVKVKKHKKKNN